jgi:DNA processing protein
MSRGPAKLLKNGAKVVESAADIAEEFGFPVSVDSKGSPAARNGSQAEQQILGALANGPMQIDSLARKVNLTIQTVGSTITVLEMRGLVRDIGDKNYILINTG